MGRNMSLYTAALLLCVLSLSAAANEDLSTAPSARSLLGKAKKKKSENKGSTVLVLDVSVTDGVHTFSARNPGNSRRGHFQYTTGKPQKATPPASPGSSSKSGKKKKPSRRSPIGSRRGVGFFSSTRTPGHSAFYGFYGSGDVDLNEVPTGADRSTETEEEELPHGEMDLSYKGHKSASKSPPKKKSTKPAPKPPSKPALKPAAKPGPKATATTGFTARGVVQSSTRLRVGLGSSSTTRRSPFGQSRGFPRRRSIRG